VPSGKLKLIEAYFRIAFWSAISGHTTLPHRAAAEQDFSLSPKMAGVGTQASPLSVSLFLWLTNLSLSNSGSRNRIPVRFGQSVTAITLLIVCGSSGTVFDLRSCLPHCGSIPSARDVPPMSRAVRSLLRAPPQSPAPLGFLTQQSCTSRENLVAEISSVRRSVDAELVVPFVCKSFDVLKQAPAS
jgi:hypothetical protein